jgi:malate permease and related proteins
MTTLLSTLGSILLTVIVPLFVLVAVGWSADRKFGLHLETLVKMTMYIFVPAFVFVRLVESSLEPGLAPALAGATLIVVAGMGVLSVLVAKVRADPPATLTAMMLANMFYNCGNFGVPAMKLAFGARAAEIQVFVLVTMNITTFTIGTLIATWHHDTSGWRKMLPMLRQPAVYAVILALVLRESSLHPREWPLWEPLRLLADGTIGFMLLVLGVQLSKINPPPLGGGLFSIVIVRLLVGPAIAWGAASAFGFDKETTKVLILGAGAPAAINTALLAHEFNADTRLAAAAVFYTTLLSAVTVTLVLAVLRMW